MYEKSGRQSCVTIDEKIYSDVEIVVLEQVRVSNNNTLDDTKINILCGVVMEENNNNSDLSQLLQK